MTTLAETYDRLRNTDGFVVESSEGDLGWVEEVWLGEEDEPAALAVRTGDGRHGLLLGEDILSVDRENRWIVVPVEPILLELEAPRVVTDDGNPSVPLAASWRTTGARLSVTPRPRRLWHLPYRPAEPAPPVPKRPTERPLWQGVAILLSCIALLAAFTITLAFVIADLVTGR